jgi:hypothetical protein
LQTVSGDIDLNAQFLVAQALVAPNLSKAASIRIFKVTIPLADQVVVTCGVGATPTKH